MVSDTQYSQLRPAEDFTDPRHKDFYHKLRAGVRDWPKHKHRRSSKWSEYILFAPDLFHLLCKLSFDSQVPAKIKLKLAGAIAYFASPFDLMPEALMGFIGFSDDIALAAYVLNSTLNSCNPDILKRHWAGDQDVLELIQRIMNWTDSMGRSAVLRTRVLAKLRKMFK